MITLKTQSGRLDLEARVLRAGPDLMVLVTGGEAHLGAVAAATPRPSLADPQKTSATASVLAFVGHKEDDLAKHLAEALAARLERRVVVAAGCHWDGLGPDDIALVRRNAAELPDLIVAALAAEADPS